MKKETKRYMLVEYAGLKQKSYDTIEELDKALEDIRKYNNRKTSKFICGNISIEEINGKYYLNSHLYNKLTNKNTISDIDSFTCNFNNKSELYSMFLSKSITREGYEPDINIAYFETMNITDEYKRPLLFGVRYIPICYYSDLKYFDTTFIKKCLVYHAENLDFDFFRSMVDEFRYVHSCSKELDELIQIINKLENEGYNKFFLSDTAYTLFSKLIVERESNGYIVRDNNGKYQISKRRFRDFAFFVKNYGSLKRNSPLNYNGSLTQIKKEYLSRLRDGLLEQDKIKSLKLN